jgi:hypothetical protein
VRPTDIMHSFLLSVNFLTWKICISAHQWTCAHTKHFFTIYTHSYKSCKQLYQIIKCLKNIKNKNKIFKILLIITFPKSKSMNFSSFTCKLSQKYYLFWYSFFLCWGFIVAFTKVLTLYQKYHTWIHPLHHFPFSLLPPFLE